MNKVAGPLRERSAKFVIPLSILDTDSDYLKYTSKIVAIDEESIATDSFISGTFFFTPAFCGTTMVSR